MEEENNLLHRSDQTFFERHERLLKRLEEKLDAIAFDVRENIPHQLAKMEHRIMGNLDTINQGLTQIGTDVGGIATDIATETASLTTINTDLATIAAKLSAAGSDGISATDAAKLAQQITAISQTVSTTRANLDTAASGLTAVQTQTDTLAGGATGATGPAGTANKNAPA